MTMAFRIQIVFAIGLFLVAVTELPGQEPTPDEKAKPPEVLLQDFRPQSMLRVAETKLSHGKFPAIDVHTHFGFRLRGSDEQLDEYVQVMDANSIALSVSLDAKLGQSLDEHLAFLNRKYSGRFAAFAYLDWQGDGKSGDWSSWNCNRPDFSRQCVEYLELAKQQGIVGVKFFKQFGLEYRNADGSLIPIDDPRFDSIWEACGELGLPVLIHTADPAAFFLPIDKTNERYEELLRHPEWSFFGKDYPSRESLLAALNRVIERFPNTTFIGAHVANNAEDLATVAKWLDRYSNLYLDTASRIAELGRQPNTAREFFIRYQDRILFGTDGPWPAQRLEYYWRFFETRDDYFPYSEKEFPPQGLWRISGLNLPDEVLRKIYFENVIRIIPALTEKYESAASIMSAGK
jgi:predicted TIM-barrel fold metal-dependent hydrolase